jgi:hypothetical protein
MQAGLGTMVKALSSYLTEYGMKEGTLWGLKVDRKKSWTLMGQKGRHTCQFFSSFNQFSFSQKTDENAYSERRAHHFNYKTYQVCYSSILYTVKK